MVTDTPALHECKTPALSKELFVQSAINTLSTTSVESDEAFNIRSSHSESLSGLVSVT